MRKSVLYLSLFTLLMLAFTMSSCKKKKSVEQLQEQFLVQPTASFRGVDTAEVKQLVDNFIKSLNEKDIRGAVAQLSFLDGDSIVTLPAGLQKRQANALMNMQGIRYEVDKLVFDREIDNIAKINVILFDKEANDPRPNLMTFYLKPIRRNGKWYLTTADNVTDTNQLGGTQIKN